MWRILLDLKVDLAMPKESGVDTVFQYRPHKNIYAKCEEKCYEGTETTHGYELCVGRGRRNSSGY